MIDADTRAACEATVGRSRVIEDSLAPETAAKLAAVLGVETPDRLLPPTWHWGYFNQPVCAADLGRDYHERTGLFLPDAPFPRRMWAAGQVTVHMPLTLGLPASQTIRIADVAFKEGRSGAMCFVTLSQRVEQEGALCIEEEKTIVYRDRGAPEPALRTAEDPVPESYFIHPESQLFFYSALTHNGHRIHWDHDFCRAVEGYPDLVVHGPLMATELCDAMRGHRLSVRFTYRAQAPVFTTTPVRIDPGAPGETREGRMLRSDGVTSMTGRLSPL